MILGAQRHGLGGAERIAQAIEAALVADGWELEWFTADNVPNAPRSARYPGLNEMLRAGAISQAVRRLPKVDLTISHGTCGAMVSGPRLHVYHGTFAGLALACRAGLPSLDFQVLRYLNGGMERWSGTGALRVTVSRRVAGEVSRLYGLRGCQVVHNGISLGHFRPDVGKRLRSRWNLPEDRFLMLAVGRMDYGKGREVLKEMMERLPASVHLVLAAPSSSGLERLPAERLHLIPGVPYEELPQLYAACDVLSCTSLYEGFGLTLIEAWASGIPVVTGRVGVVEELVGQEPSFDACVANVGDAPRLAEAVARLQGEPSLAARQVAWGQGVTRERFSSERFAAAYQALARCAVEGGRPDESLRRLDSIGGAA